jgi:DNA-binding NtrC family response regulator
MVSESAQPGHFSQMEKKSAALNVLVVDDEPLIRWSLAEALGDCGGRVVESGDAQATRDALHATAGGFDVILLDFRLPDSQDLALLAYIREFAPHTPVILMTAHGAPEVVAAALELGALRVVAKPFELHDMTNLVAAAARRRS